MATTISEAITEAALGPAKVATEGVSAESHPLPDLIAADKYRAAKAAAAKNHRGFYWAKADPGGGG